MLNGTGLGVTENTEPLQTVSNKLFTNGTGFTGTIKVKVDPIHPALEGVTV